MLELDLDNMVVRKDGAAVAPIFADRSYGKMEAQALADASKEIGRTLTVGEALAVLMRGAYTGD